MAADETTARQFIISTLIFGAVVAAIFSLMSLGMPDDNTQYGISNTTLNKFETLKTNSNSIKEPLINPEPASGPEGILSGLIDVSWGSLKAIWGSFSTMTSLLNDLASGALGISLPSWFTGMIISILGIVIAFAMMAAWFKWYI
jgi:hypothetical protein